MRYNRLLISVGFFGIFFVQRKGLYYQAIRRCKSDTHPLRDVARSGYKSNMKYKKNSFYIFGYMLKMKYEKLPRVFSNIKIFFSIFFPHLIMAIGTLKKALHFFFENYFTFW
jgi:hypothetical protein